MSWHVEGTYFENCNCDFACPCTVTPGEPATGDRCTFLVAFNIQRGEIEGVDVGGRAVAWLAETPKKIGDGIAVEIQDFIVEGMPEPVRVSGLPHPVNSTLTIAKPTSSRIRAFGLEFHNDGKSAFSAPFRWSG